MTPRATSCSGQPAAMSRVVFQRTRLVTLNVLRIVACAAALPSAVSAAPECATSDGANTAIESILQRRRPENASLELEDGRTVSVQHVSSQPLAFVIDDYLTEAEVRRLEGLAGAARMTPARTHQGGPSNKNAEAFDLDDDDRLSLAEMRITIEQMVDVLLSEQQVRAMYFVLGVRTDKAERITKAEMMAKLSPSAVRNFAAEVARSNPGRRSREADVAWLTPESDALVGTLRTRLGRLLGVERGPAAHFGTTLQLVRYRGGGHYQAHYDSSDRFEGAARPCCHLSKRGAGCRSCRWATLLYYLSGSESAFAGGKTAFPLASEAGLPTPLARPPAPPPTHHTHSPRP